MAQNINISDSEFAEKWNRNLKNAQRDVERGVNNVQDNPAEQAIAAQDKMRQNLVEAIDNGKWANGLRRVGLSDWKTAMLETGLQRLAQGADNAKGKVQKFARQLLEYEKDLQQNVKGMPDVTLSDAESRMVEWMRGMAEFRKE